MPPRATLAVAFATFLLAFSVRIANLNTAFVGGVPQFPPFDDLYHAKRIAYSAAHPFQVLDFDPNRGPHGSFCPWPPLYDLIAGGAARALGGATALESLVRAAWFPPIVASLVAAVIAFFLARRFDLATGFLSGTGVALSVYYLGRSQIGTIDHHFLELPLLLGIIAATLSLRRATTRKEAIRQGCLLGLVLVVALLVQTALVLAAGVALLGLLFMEREKVVARLAASIGFGLGSVILFAYRLVQPPGYPDNEWYLGIPHAAAFLGAAVACATQFWLLEKGASLWRAATYALVTGLLAVAAIPNAAEALVGGSGFLGGDPWFESISEFQPLFFSSPWRDSVWWIDLILLGGGALLIVPSLFGRRWRQGSRRLYLFFAIGYLVGALSSNRLLSVAAPLLAISGAVLFSDLRRSGRKRLAALTAALLLAPGLFSIGRAVRTAPGTVTPEAGPILRTVASLSHAAAAPGRVLARGTWGHLFNVTANRAVLMDNFGPVSAPTEFQNAAGIILETREKAVAEYCASKGVRFVVLENPLPLFAVQAEISGRPRSAFETRSDSSQDLGSPTALTKASFWWRAYFEGGGERAGHGPAGETFRHFRLVHVEREPPPYDRYSAVQTWELIRHPTD